MRFADAPADDEADDGTVTEAAEVPQPRPAPDVESEAQRPATAPGAGPVPQPRSGAGSEVETPPDGAEVATGAGAGTAAGSAATPGGPALSEREREILAFERRWWRHAGAKEQAIRDAFDLSATRYYQLLNGLLDNPAALAADPVLVARLRRLRATRSRNRRR
ncbi:DUF3263 domain-containing protein [Plantactinospora sp. CA-290183]|uniref:DUF3263 domain-containing protein n=1 Tax=Plantactinospora sp. CA-290183 TaxID=3240006 RepID=UPI003D944247